MGREAITFAEVGGEGGEVKALLEARELILLGPIRRRYAKDHIADLRVEAGALCFASDGEAVALHLGEDVAKRWASAIQKPLPSLREKLDLKGLALVIGRCEDADLAAALAGARTDEAAAASVIIACIENATDLHAALAVPGALPIWAVYPKGRSDFGDAAIRSHLRERGYRDTKSCAVSDRRTATRYQLPRGAPSA